MSRRPCSSIAAAAAAWLEATVEGITPSPRQAITAAPFAAVVGGTVEVSGVLTVELVRIDTGAS